MTLTFKSVSSLCTLLLLTTLFSCSKNIDATAASQASGTYKGVISIITDNKITLSQYNDYVVKIEPSSSEKVMVSCVSEPKAFESFEATVAMQDNTVNSINSRKHNIFYTVPSLQLQLNVEGAFPTAAFTGYKQK